MTSNALFNRRVQRSRKRNAMRLRMVDRSAFLGSFSALFPPTIFADLYQNDPYGRVRILDLYQYTMRKMWYHHSRMGLSLYDSIGQGYLRESVRHVGVFLSRFDVHFSKKRIWKITFTNWFRRCINWLNCKRRFTNFMFARQCENSSSFSIHCERDASPFRTFFAAVISTNYSKWVGGCPNNFSEVFIVLPVTRARRRCRWTRTKLVFLSIGIENLHALLATGQRSQRFIIAGWIIEVMENNLSAVDHFLLSDTAWALWHPSSSRVSFKNV